VLSWILVGRLPSATFLLFVQQQRADGTSATAGISTLSTADLTTHIQALVVAGQVAALTFAARPVSYGLVLDMRELCVIVVCLLCLMQLEVFIICH